MRTFDYNQFWPLASQSSDAGKAVLGDRHDVATNPLSVTDLRPDAASLSLTAHDRFEPQDRAAVDTAPGVLTANALRHHMVRAKAFARGFDPQAATWLSVGFIAGMAAWHAVGFWGFVSKTVLNDVNRPGAMAAATPQSQHRVAFREIITTGSLPTFNPQPSACVALVADRTGGTTMALPCGGDHSPMRDAGRRRRGDRLAGIGDRLQKPESWAAATELENATADLSSDSNTVTDADFDLSFASAKSGQ